MGYYLHYLSTDTQSTDLETMAHTLQQNDPDYTIHNSPILTTCDVYFASQHLAQIQIIKPTDDLFEDELEALKDTIGEARTPEELYVLEVLNNTKEIISIETFWEGGDGTTALNKLDPLWDWLFANRTGILQADGEGFYNEERLIVARNFTL